MKLKYEFTTLQVNTTITDDITHFFVDVLFVRPTTPATAATTTTIISSTLLNQNKSSLHVAILQNIFGPNANKLMQTTTTTTSTTTPPTTVTTTNLSATTKNSQEKITGSLSNQALQQLKSSLNLTNTSDLDLKAVHIRDNEFKKLISSIDNLSDTLEIFMAIVLIPVILVIVCCFCFLFFACHHHGRDILRDKNSNTSSLSSHTNIRDI